MHITLCTDGVFPLALGGMQRHSRLLAEELARIDGVRLTVIHPHAQRVFDPALCIQEVRVPPIDPKALYLRQLWKYSGHVAQRLEELQPDAIISQGFSVWKDLDRFGARTIVHPHGLEMFQVMSFKEKIIGLPFRWALRGIMRRASIVISLGGELTRIIRDQVKGSKARVEVVPNAVDVPRDPVPYPAGDAPLKLLFVGRFAFNKGIDVLMRVATIAQQRLKGRVEFLLAGDGPLLEHYRAQGLPANVRLLGRVDDERLFKLYEECHALVLPTRFEGMPTVVLEAMARCRPIFVSDVGATAELVDEENGFLLPKGDAEALYSAIERYLMMDHTQRARMGLKGHERAWKNYRWSVVAQRTHDLARQLVRS